MCPASATYFAVERPARPFFYLVVVGFSFFVFWGFVGGGEVGVEEGRGERKKEEEEEETKTKSKKKLANFFPDFNSKPQFFPPPRWFPPAFSYHRERILDTLKLSIAAHE